MSDLAAMDGGNMGGSRSGEVVECGGNKNSKNTKNTKNRGYKRGYDLVEDKSNSNQPSPAT